MRRFEFVEGGSGKFWEIERDGSEVTVRWGRVGTSGQTKVKTFDNPASAAAHETKLMAEKTKKGYAESTAAAVSAPVAPPDEDTFVFPPAWYRHRHARRGSSGAVAFTPKPEARTIVDKEMTDRINQVLQAPTTDMAVALQALAWREGKPDATPLGAAVVAAAAEVGNWRTRDQLMYFADVWIAEHGLRFAAEAATELMSLKVTDDSRPPGVHYSRPKVDTLGVRHMRAGEARDGYHVNVAVEVTLRVRQALAASSDVDYAEVIAALTPYRAGHVYARAATSMLVPTQRDWVADDITGAVAAGDGYLAAVLTAAAATKDELDALVPVASTWLVIRSLPMLATLVDGVGAGSAAALFHWLGQDSTDADSQRRLLSILERLPGDEVTQGLIDRVDHKYVAPTLLEAAQRYPVRTLRLLAESASRRTIADLLRAHVLAHPELVDRVRPRLSPEAAKRVDVLVGDAASLRVAPLSAVPSLLVDPPWQRRVKAAKPVVLADLECREPATIDWADGERDAWATVSIFRQGLGKDASWERRWHRIHANDVGWLEAPSFLAEAPEDYVRPLLAWWRPNGTYLAGDWMRVIIARFGLDSLPLALDVARRSPAETAKILAPFFSVEVAVLMAECFARLKSVRATALAWLLRHAAPAAGALVPVALSTAGVPRRQAENALLALHHNGEGDAVRAAARAYGAEAAAAIDALLDSDPLTMLPARMPGLPGWATPGLLPPVRLRDGSGVLPLEAVTNLIAMLAISRIDLPYAGVDVVKAACDPVSLAEFGWGLFQRWQMSGSPSKENWVLDTLGLIGDDETVRLLSPLVLAWPGEGGHSKAVTGLSVLAAIGTDVALMHLHGIAQRAKFKGLKAAARQKMDEVAAELGLSAEQLADRLVPDLGLDDDGSMRLDYGPRQFTVGFDEQLRPFVADAAGKRLKALPKPGARDDDELAPAAYRTFSGLKKDVRTIAADQIRRLERAMVTGRRWTGAEFRQLFVSHPLLWHIVRRLVWVRYDEAGALIGALRVAEDRSFATVDDDEMTLADDATVGVAHPLQLGDTLAGWVEMFADYEILQPFPQLSRPTFTLTGEEAASSRLTRFEGATVPTGRIIGLERRGWQREAPQDAGIQGSIELAVDDKRAVVIGLDPGVAVGAMDIFPEQKLEHVYLWSGDGSRWGNRGESALALSELDAITVSEVIRDLTEITA
jgi:predicted DNA-binding WGR domain protein